MSVHAVPSFPKTDFMAVIFDAMPLPALVVDRQACIVEFNVAGAKLLERIPFAVLRPNAGEAIRCIHTIEDPASCGQAPACERCIIWNSLRAVFDEGRPGRTTGRLSFFKDGQRAEEDFLVTTAPIPGETEPFALLILEDARELSGLLEASARKPMNLSNFLEELRLEQADLAETIRSMERLAASRRRRGRPSSWIKTPRVERAPGKRGRPHGSKNKPKVKAVLVGGK